MRIVRIEHCGEVFHGILKNEKVRRVRGNIFEEYDISNEAFNVNEVRLLSPVIPPNIIAIGLNYRGHARESGSELPKRPVIFLKATTSLLDPGEEIVLPAEAPRNVDYEAELAVIIKKRAKRVSREEALDYVLGYTCGNDVSARDCQLELDVQWARGKSFDTFCPLGPWIETDMDPDCQPIRTLLNGEVVQDSNTEDMIFSVPEIVSYCSRNMTLLPGTVIMTGTPEGVGFARKPALFLSAGDQVEVKIGSIGTLTNGVVEEKVD